MHFRLIGDLSPTICELLLLSHNVYRQQLHTDTIDSLFRQTHYSVLNVHALTSIFRWRYQLQSQSRVTELCRVRRHRWQSIIVDCVSWKKKAVTQHRCRVLKILQNGSFDGTNTVIANTMSLPINTILGRKGVSDVFCLSLFEYHIYLFIFKF